MDGTKDKCVMVLNNELPIGWIANAAAIMGITLGKYIPEAIGESVQDKHGQGHLGVIQFPVPILKGSFEKIKELRERLYDSSFDELIVVDFFDVAQSCKTYDEYIAKMKQVEEKDLTYYGIALCGRKKLVNKLTGELPLLR